MNRFLISAILAALSVSAALTQSSSDSPAFEAVSIKPSQPGARGGGYNVNTGRLVAKNQSLRDLVKFGFGLQEYQLTGGPAWQDTDRYEIVATHPGAIKEAERRLMMQAMLADRFGLVIHRESKEISGYALVACKSGPKIHAVEPGQHSMMLGRDAKTSERTLTATSAGMAGLAEILANILARPVADKTGLEGLFDFAMEWTPDETQVGLRIPGKEVAEPPADGPTGPSLFNALQDKLGLRLIADKAPVEVIVIDSAQKPSAN
jgi:uncharacterized protein (TIGR03435 family)